MRGIVFTAFLTFLDGQKHEGIVNRILDELEPELKNSAFTSVNHYPSKDLKTMLAAASRAMNEPVADMVRDFGTFLFRHLMSKLGMHVEEYDTWQAMLTNVEVAIHESVQKLEPERKIPVFLTPVEDANSALSLHYKSPRGMADLAEGLILGCLQHYGVDQNIAVCRIDLADDGTSSIFKMNQREI